MKKLTVTMFCMFAICSGSSFAEKLTVKRLEASPGLSGTYAKGVQISPDGERVTFLQGRADNKLQQDLWEYHIADGKKRMLVDSTALLGGAEELDEVELARRERQRISATGIVEYGIAPDGKALLFPLGGDLYYLPIGGEPRRLTETDATETDAKVSPGGAFVSFIREKNLYIIDLATGKERAITTEGAGPVTFGMADFAAQEEMYRSTGYWWAKDDSRIAFTKVDESGVTLVNRYEISADGVTSIPQRYPFAGEDNAIVQLFVVTLANGDLMEVELGADKDFYLPRVAFSPDGTLAVQKQSRDQKRLDLILVDPKTGDQQIVLAEQSKTWINLHSDLHFFADGSHFTWTSERSGFRHIYLYAKNGEMVRQLTSGNWPVSESSRRGGGIKAVDEEGGYIYFTGWSVTATEQHLFRAPLSGEGVVTRLTEAGGWHSAEVAPDGSFFIDNGSSPDRPPYSAIRDRDGNLLIYITENALDETHPYFPYLPNHRPREFGVIETSEGVELQYELTLPTDFDAAKQYPAVVYLYGGPGGASVKKYWSVGLNQVLAQNGFVVFTVDNRGTGNRGTAFDDVIYKNMGDFEVRDQVTGAKWLADKPYVDASRVGVYGWSYGGYMTLLCMFKAPEVFKAGIAGAPVVNWRLYDTHYTERYMADPADGDFYERSSPITYVDGLEGNLLLIHGMADDNVFFDNSVQLMAALQQAEKQFELMTYPGKRHGIRGEAERVHLNQMRLDFFKRHLQTSAD
jgi:dipeptidyl-peptidase-4